jgi:DNA-binding transcriptional ArsR family regulator
MFMKGTIAPVLDTVFTALSDPTRRAILVRLVLGRSDGS